MRCTLKEILDIAEKGRYLELDELSAAAVIERLK